jgi:hypothetical protein
MSPHRYRVVVEGELGPRYASAFGQMTLSAHDGETEITGMIIDSSHLHGVLDRIASLGLTLRSVNPLEAETGTPAAVPHRTNRELRATPADAPDGSREPATLTIRNRKGKCDG